MQLRWIPLRILCCKLLPVLERLRSVGSFAEVDKQVALPKRDSEILSEAPDLLRFETRISDEMLCAVRKVLDDGKPRAHMVNLSEKCIPVPNA
jgi:hypothetical protein